MDLLVIDQEPIRRAATLAYRQSKDRLDALRVTVAAFSTVDRPAFGGWLAARFGPLLTELRELDRQITEKGQELQTIRLMTLMSGCSPHEAYKEVLRGKAEEEMFAARQAAGENPDAESAEEDPFADIFAELDEMFGFAGPSAAGGRPSPPPPEADPGPRASDRPGRARPTRRQTPAQETKSQRLKTAYRTVVRRLHPDLNPDLSAYDQQLWHEARDAYEKEDLERLETILAVGELEGSGELPSGSGLSGFLALLRQMEASIRNLERQTRSLKKDLAWNFTVPGADRESLAQKVSARLRGDVAASREELAMIEADLAFCRQAPVRRSARPANRRPNRKGKVFGRACRPPPSPRGGLEVFTSFLRLGLTAFGGPVAHLGFFHAEFVVRRRWVDENTYADLVALCQFLPGPASSQVGMALGLRRAGLPGMGLAWLGFTLPSAVLMIAFGYGVRWTGATARAGWMQGLQLAAVAVVAQAVWTMAQRLCPDRARATLALLAAALVLAWNTAGMQVAAIAAGALAGRVPLARTRGRATAAFSTGCDRAGFPAGEGDRGARGVFHPAGRFAAAARVWPGVPGLRVFSGFYRAGSLVFGGGHVILPLLQAETVTPGWISPERFLAGYGAAQALPGPLSTFAGYLGASLPAPARRLGGRAAVSGGHFPAVGAAGAGRAAVLGPRAPSARRASGATRENAAVVGVLLAALYQPVWTSAVHGPRDFLLALLRSAC